MQHFGFVLNVNANKNQAVIQAVARSRVGDSCPAGTGRSWGEHGHGVPSMLAPEVSSTLNGSISLGSDGRAEMTTRCGGNTPSMRIRISEAQFVIDLSGVGKHSSTKVGKLRQARRRLSFRERSGPNGHGQAAVVRHAFWLEALSVLVHHPGLVPGAVSNTVCDVKVEFACGTR